MIDASLKQQVLERGLDKIEKNVSIALYSQYILELYGVVIYHKMSVEEAKELDIFYRETAPILWDVAHKLNRNLYDRTNRLHKRISSMLKKSECLFLTFTFTDKVLNNTTADTRRQKVRRFLKSYNADYVANIDFGAKNGREHYHALIALPKIDYKAYNYGALNGEKVRHSTDSIKLSKYIAKLTNHSLKQTAKSSRIIYNR